MTRADAGSGRVPAAGGRPGVGSGSDSPLPSPDSPNPSSGSRLAVVLDDLAFFTGDAIARPVTAQLGATTPLGRRLELAALEGERGAKLAAQLRVAEPLAVGSAVVTGAGALGVELLLHAVVSSVTERATRETVARATASALQRAAAFEVRHLALAPFGLGAGNLDPDDSAAAMLDAVGRHLARAPHPARISIVVETEDEHRAFAARLSLVEGG